MLDSLYDLEVPEQLREVAQRHQQHVAELAFRLAQSGLDDAIVERTVDELIVSYRAELLRAIRSLGSNQHD